MEGTIERLNLLNYSSAKKLFQSERNGCQIICKTLGSGGTSISHFIACPMTLDTFEVT